MVSDSDMGTEEAGGQEDEEEEEQRGGEGVSESTYGAAEEGKEEEEGEAGGMAGEGEAASSAQAEELAGKPKATRGGGRRAALKIIRQNVESLSKDVAGFRKSHEANSKRLEKQIASLRNDVNSLKSYFAKESAKARSKQEASLSRIFNKLNTAKKPAASPKKASSSSSRKKGSSSSKTKSRGKK